MAPAGALLPGSPGAILAAASRSRSSPRLHVLERSCVLRSRAATVAAWSKAIAAGIWSARLSNWPVPKPSERHVRFHRPAVGYLRRRSPFLGGRGGVGCDRRGEGRERRLDLRGRSRPAGIGPGHRRMPRRSGGPSSGRSGKPLALGGLEAGTSVTGWLDSPSRRLRGSRCGASTVVASVPAPGSNPLHRIARSCT